MKALFSTIGRRGAFLLFLALLDWIYAYSLAFPTSEASRSETFVFLRSIAPIGMWAALWAVVGTLCCIFAFRRYDAPGYAAAMFVKILWAVLFLLGWLYGGVERAYLSTTIWGAFAAVLGLISTWPEPKAARELMQPHERER